MILQSNDSRSIFGAINFYGRFGALGILRIFQEINSSCTSSTNKADERKEFAKMEMTPPTLLKFVDGLEGKFMKRLALYQEDFYCPKVWYDDGALGRSPRQGQALSVAERMDVVKMKDASQSEEKGTEKEELGGSHEEIGEEKVGDEEGIQSYQSVEPEKVGEEEGIQSYQSVEPEKVGDEEGIQSYQSVEPDKVGDEEGIQLYQSVEPEKDLIGISLTVEDIDEKVEKAMLASLNDSGSGHSATSFAENMDVSTNTSQPMFMDATSGRSRGHVNVVDCGTGSSQPFLIECGVQTSQSLMESPIKPKATATAVPKDASTFLLSAATKAPVIFPRLALQTIAPEVLPKRPRLNDLNNYGESHSIYTAKTALAYEFDETEKENNFELYDYMTERNRNSNSSTFAKPGTSNVANNLDQENNQNTSIGKQDSLGKHSVSRSPFLRVGLSKSRKSGGSQKQVRLHQMLDLPEREQNSMKD